MSKLNDKPLLHKFKVKKGESKFDLLAKRGLDVQSLDYVRKNPIGKTIYFNSIIACTYGVNSAIFFNHISFYLKLNASKKTNFKDGKYWTYGSIEDLRKQYFPFFSATNLRTAIRQLLEDRIIIRGRYNKHNYDKTIWYTINEERFSLIFDCEYKELLIPD